ncbi:hypothetical protein ACH492_33060 [Streptomyces sp. NPDC019443]|uniref:hypothetical protein n=1 Tax=Streptomyces sp. NPDC019443 TaxID=3365061 RepID=UPI00379D56F9
MDSAMRELITARQWLTVFRFPAYAPDLNPAEGVSAHLGDGDHADQVVAVANREPANLAGVHGTKDLAGVVVGAQVTAHHDGVRSALSGTARDLLTGQNVGGVRSL